MTPRAERRLCFLLALALYAAATHPRVFSAGNDAARWAQVESIVDQGRTSIAGSRFRGTIDKVVVGGREYPNKPPLLGLAGAALYAPLSALTGWRIADPETGGRVIRTLTLLLVGLPAAAGVALFHRSLERGGTGRRRRLALVLALAAGTLYATFAVTLDNHVPAAACLLAAALCARDDRPGRAGLWCGLAGALDLLPGFGLAPFLAGALPGEGVERRRRIARFAAGAAAGVALLALSNLLAHGSPLPAKMLPGAVDLAAQAGPSALGVVLPESAGYPLEILVGPHGLLAVSPVLLVGVWGLAREVRRPLPAPPRFWGWLAAGLAVQYLGHALVAGSYGGWSYGYRYLIPIQPLLLLAAPAALELRAARALFAALLPLSLLFAGLGAYHPWPPAYEQASSAGSVAARVTNPIGGNAAALAAARWPESALAEALGRRFVDADPQRRREYFALFFGTKGDVETRRRFLP